MVDSVASQLENMTLGEDSVGIYPPTAGAPTTDSEAVEDYNPAAGMTVGGAAEPALPEYSFGTCVQAS